MLVKDIVPYELVDLGIKFWSTKLATLQQSTTSDDIAYEPYRLKQKNQPALQDTANPLSSSDAYMRLLTMLSLVQMMAGRLFGTKPFCGLMLDWTLVTNFNEHLFSQNANISCQENAFEKVVCKMAAIFFLASMC